MFNIRSPAIRTPLIAFFAALLTAPLQGFELPPVNGDCALGYEYFRSLPEGDWPGNTGSFAALNGATPLPYCGAGFQLGGSYGLYDWSGRGSAPSCKQPGLQQQLFITAALFRKTVCASGYNVGLAYDWMWNKRYGVFGLQSSFGQLRLQAGYLRCQRDEFGFWGTIDLYRSHRSTQGLPVQFRALAQVNVFWRHLFENCAETTVWIGVPYKRSLAYSSGRAGKFIVGGSFHAPLCGRLSIDGYASYMAPHSAVGGFKERNYGANICIELKYAFGDGNPCTTPYMAIGNNSNFIADTSVVF